MPKNSDEQNVKKIQWRWDQCYLNTAPLAQL